MCAENYFCVILSVLVGYDTVRYMSIRLQKFIENQLQTAQYEYDKSVKSWIGWLPRFRGVYSQGKNLESVRNQLAEILEEQVFLSVKNRKPVKGFSLKLPVHA